MSKLPGSLRHALTRQMIIVQLLVLFLFAVLVTIPIASLTRGESDLDDRVVTTIVDSIHRNATGSLELVPNSEALSLTRTHPKFWFIAEDAAGRSLRFGKVPPDPARNVGDITRISSANITDTGNPDTPTAILRTTEGPDGTLWILTAGGPPLGNRLLLEVLGNPYFLMLALAVTAVSLLALPVLVNRQLNGVEGLASEADSIDIDQRGVRLAPASVPTEIRPLVKAFNAALARLDEGIERQRRFMADAAHELRTPIAILQARLELPAEAFDRKRLLLDVARLSTLANQLLDLQRLDILAPDMEQLDLVELAAEVSAELVPLAITAGTTMTFHTELESYQINGDRGSLSRALTNVMQNALVHGGKNGQIHVAVKRGGIIWIEDSGPGIPLDQREAIFAPFHRLSQEGKGAGLGLHLVRDILQRHDGRISVKGSSFGGACFELRFPATN